MSSDEDYVTQSESTEEEEYALSPPRRKSQRVMRKRNAEEEKDPVVVAITVSQIAEILHIYMDVDKSCEYACCRVGTAYAFYMNQTVTVTKEMLEKCSYGRMLLMDFYTSQLERLCSNSFKKNGNDQ